MWVSLEESVPLVESALSEESVLMVRSFWELRLFGPIAVWTVWVRWDPDPYPDVLVKVEYHYPIHSVSYS